MTRLKLGSIILAALLVGFILGGYTFARTRPRSFLALNSCDGKCLQANELLGLITSVGLQRFSVLAPRVIKETDKTIAIEHPSPEARNHYLIIPKRDMKDIADMSDDDREYLTDALKVAGEIIRGKKLTNYRLTTNGPGYQAVTYLHFHLMAN